MGRHGVSPNLNSLNAVVWKNFRPLRSPPGLSICNRYILSWFICSWRSADDESAHHFPCSPRSWSWRLDGTHIRDHWRYRLSSRPRQVPGLFWRRLGTFFSCRSTSRWILLRSRPHFWNRWLALDFLHKPSNWISCSCYYFSKPSYSKGKARA